MNFLAVLFLMGSGTALLVLPRKWALLPLLLGACYMTRAQGIDLGVFYFSVLRLLVAVGILRVLLKGERPSGGFNGLDWLMLAWAGWALCSSAFHEEPADILVNHMGMVYNTCGIYFLVRCFCRSLDEVAGLVKMTAIVLAPVALEMVNEQFSGRNVFSLFGGVPAEVMARAGRFRAQGPFAHPILAGTVGAVCLPLMIGIWRRYPWVAKMGVAACLLMVLASASSGPLMSMVFGVFALLLWHWRHLSRRMRITAIAGYILLDIVMKAPAYYLIARIDLTGSSTGWHRARLIEAAFQHLGEWWFAGTDYTRHWMPYGVPWSENHADITNHYLAMGVHGGLPLMLLFIGILWCAFRCVGRAMRNQDPATVEDQFLMWAFGASLFVQAATSVSVAYFDQSILFLNVNLAVISSLIFATSRESKSDDVVTKDWEEDVQTSKTVPDYV